MGTKHWTSDELKKFREIYPKTPMYILCEIFGRRNTALRTKASKLGLKAEFPYHRPEKWGDPLHNPYEELTEGERGYIAGILDGEGTISFFRASCKTMTTMRARITIWNTDYSLIEWVHSKIGGTIRMRKGRKATHNDCWWLALHGIVKVKHLLKVLLPYLIVKKKQAQEIIDYHSKFDF